MFVSHPWVPSSHGWYVGELVGDILVGAAVVGNTVGLAVVGAEVGMLEAMHVVVDDGANTNPGLQTHVHPSVVEVTAHNVVEGSQVCVPPTHGCGVTVGVDVGCGDGWAVPGKQQHSLTTPPHGSIIVWWRGTT